MASTVLEFAAQPSDSLPAAIASFAHPVHVDGVLFGTEPFAIVEGDAECPELGVVVPALEGPSHQNPASEPGQLAAYSV